MVTKTLRKIYYRIIGCLVRRKYQRICVGKNSFVDNTVQVFGWNNTLIGENTSVGEGSVLIVNNRTTTSEKKIVIGDKCIIGRNNFFSAGNSIRLREYVMTTYGCRFLGANHHFNDPSQPYILTGVSNENDIYIGVNCWIGFGVTVIGNVRIGHGSVIGADSLISKDVPPFSVVIGNPQRIIRRYDFNKKEWRKVSESDENDYNQPTEEAYLEMLRSTYPHIPVAYHASSRMFGDLQ